MLQTTLLYLHIAAGTIALFSAATALATRKGGKVHTKVGRVYAIGMTVVFLTAVPLAIFGADVFLLLIAVFSFYLVLAGWRFAVNRSGRPQTVDWAAIAILGLTGIGMLVYGTFLLREGDGQWVTMLVFAVIAIALATADAIYFRRQIQSPKGGGRQRLQRHLTNMLAATIATVTAVTVVNVDMEPVWLPWILPTIVVVPVIVWWNLRIVKHGLRPLR
ncbi:MAG: hypothetical protein OXH72_09420 [Caldilineaceae bacterium]|nr:hypothetical protein [Caldilineaceae bacterium]